MKAIHQKIVNVDLANNTCMVESMKGKRYPVDLNRFCKRIEVGDTALVTKSISGWLLVDVINKYPEPLKITDFPRDKHGDYNTIEHCKYLKLIKDMPVSERVEFDKYLLDKWGGDDLSENDSEPKQGSPLEV